MWWRQPCTSERAALGGGSSMGAEGSAQRLPTTLVCRLGWVASLCKIKINPGPNGDAKTPNATVRSAGVGFTEREQRSGEVVGAVSVSMENGSGRKQGLERVSARRLQACLLHYIPSLSGLQHPPLHHPSLVFTTPDSFLPCASVTHHHRVIILGQVNVFFTTMQCFTSPLRGCISTLSLNLGSSGWCEEVYLCQEQNGHLMLNPTKVQRCWITQGWTSCRILLEASWSRCPQMSAREQLNILAVGFFWGTVWITTSDFSQVYKNWADRKSVSESISNQEADRKSLQFFIVYNLTRL